MAGLDPDVARAARISASRTASAAIAPRSSGRSFEVDLVRLGAREHQEILDEARHLARLLDDPLERLAIGGEARRFPAQRHLRLAAQHRQRRAQLVADVGEEADTRAVAVREACRSPAPAPAFAQAPPLRDWIGRRAEAFAAPRCALPSRRSDWRAGQARLAERTDAEGKVAAADGDRSGAELPDRPHDGAVEEEARDQGREDHEGRGQADPPCEHAYKLLRFAVGRLDLGDLAGDGVVDQAFELVVQLRSMSRKKTRAAASPWPASRIVSSAS